MNILNWIKRIITLPFRLFILPFFIVAGFCVTDWRRNSDREYFKESIIDLLRG